jgi:hypothetical protein
MTFDYLISFYVVADDFQNFYFHIYSRYRYGIALDLKPLHILILIRKTETEILILFKMTAQDLNLTAMKKISYGRISKSGLKFFCDGNIRRDNKKFLLQEFFQLQRNNKRKNF